MPGRRCLRDQKDGMGRPKREGCGGTRKRNRCRPPQRADRSDHPVRSLGNRHQKLNCRRKGRKRWNCGREKASLPRDGGAGEAGGTWEGERPSQSVSHSPPQCHSTGELTSSSQDPSQAWTPPPPPPRVPGDSPEHLLGHRAGWRTARPR